MLGIRIAGRITEQDFHKLIEKVEEAMLLEPGRRMARISSLVDELKEARRKDFDQHFAPDTAI